MDIQQIISLILCFNSLLVIAKDNCERNEYKLEQLQILFRHGDRTPTASDVYETDHYDEIWRSYGYGQLTKIGMRREYQIGRLLRDRYDAFLGEYRIDDVYAYSSDMDRTKMSLQLLLAGLYPPTLSSSWSDSINWQPIPTHYEALDVSFISSTIFCPKFHELYGKALNNTEINKLLHDERDFFQRLTNITGKNIPHIELVMLVYSNFRAVTSLGLPLPASFSQEDYHKLEKIYTIVSKASTSTELMKRMMAGPLVERFLKIFNDDKSKKKIHLYSGHDMNIAAFIQAHNITGAPDIQDFGSALILEKLSGSGDKKYIRVYLWTGVSEKLISLKFNKCDQTCLLSEYEKIAQPILPNKASKICTSSNKAAGRRRMETTKNLDYDLQLAYLFAGFDLTSFKYTKDYSPLMIERS